MSEIRTELEKLSEGAKRIRIHDAQTVFKLPSAVKDLIKEYGKSNGKSEGAVIRDALHEYFTRRGFNR